MCHNCHIGRTYLNILSVVFCTFEHTPDLECIVLAHRGEELLFAGSKANARDVLVVSLEGSQALDPLLEGLGGVEPPLLDRVVLRTTQEDGVFVVPAAHDIQTQNDVRMTLVKLDRAGLHVKQLQCFTIGAKQGVSAAFGDELDIDDFIKVEAKRARLGEIKALTSRKLLLLNVVYEHVLIHVNADKLSKWVIWALAVL